MYDVVAKLKEIADDDQDEARRILSGHPQLPEAMLFLMSKLDMVKTPISTEASDEIRHIVDSLNADAGTDLEKISNIYYWVQQNIKFVAFSDMIEAGSKCFKLIHPQKPISWHEADVVCKEKGMTMVTAGSPQEQKQFPKIFSEARNLNGKFMLLKYDDELYMYSVYSRTLSS